MSGRGARLCWAAIYSGAHPKAPRRKAGDKAEAKEALTLGKALERFIKERNPPLRPVTVNTYQRIVARGDLKDWAVRELASSMGEDVKKLHK